MAKLAKIEIHNLKNVKHGEMSFKNKNHYLNVVGIYGQNGSGKTTMIDAIQIFHDVVFQNKVHNNVKDFIGETPALIEFTLETDINAITYAIQLSMNPLDSENILVNSEKISISKLPNYAWKKDLISYKYDIIEDKLEFISRSEKIPEFELGVITTAKKGESFLFGDVFREWLSRIDNGTKNQQLKDTFNVIQGVMFNLSIFTDSMNGRLASGNIMPLLFMNDGKDGQRTGVLPVLLKEHKNAQKDGFFYDKETVELIEIVIDDINKVIEKIIPGLQLKKKIFEQTAKDGQSSEYRMELLTERENKSIPLRAESLGVQKILSILSVLIAVYNNPKQIAVIDEFDAGIFEYLLGELVTVFYEGAKGQLIFTSHNLRILESLPSSNIYFSTNDPEHRYTQVQTSGNNNLRNVYLREIQMNDGLKSLYQGHKTSEIKIAFENLGLNKMNNKQKHHFEFPNENIDNQEKQ